MIKQHPAYKYASKVIDSKVNAPRYVRIQCKKFKDIADGKDKKYIIDEEKVSLIDELLKLMYMPSGINFGKTIYEATIGYQWLFYIAILCTVYRDNHQKRRYEKGILEICRKNFKTFTIGTIFILLLLTEPKYSKFFSIAPEKSLSKEIQDAIREIIGVSPALIDQFKRLRDEITCKLTDNIFKPLAYSNDKLDGKKPSVFLVDEVGALPNSYAIEAMESGQLGLFNKLGCIISTKYPKIDNPFENEVKYAKMVLDDIEEDETVFALLYEPDNTSNWETDIGILEQSNPAALEIPGIMDDLLNRRAKAILMPSKRENFVTKHCNIIYQGEGTETYISVADVQKCKVNHIDWKGREVYLALDLSMTIDNCSVAMVAVDGEKILADAIAFIPEDRIEEKNIIEKIDYREFIKTGKCYACGDRTIDYGFIEKFVMSIEEKYGVIVIQIGFDRFNCISTAQKLEEAGYDTVEIKQHSSVLHAPTKLLEESILSGNFEYEENKLLEINFQNARCTYNDNLNRYVNKKKSTGKVDMVVSLINAVYLLQQNTLFGDGFVAQI